jgi:hypothetical protein
MPAARTGPPSTTIPERFVGNHTPFNAATSNLIDCAPSLAANLKTDTPSARSRMDEAWVVMRDPSVNSPSPRNVS